MLLRKICKEFNFMISRFRDKKSKSKQMFKRQNVMRNLRVHQSVIAVFSMSYDADFIRLRDLVEQRELIESAVTLLTMFCLRNPLNQ
mmetsp:Transcript_33988/g.30771  ORF Transcript_33988/g.30771 Transcript_33988/m.30771 type:complete len:87 (-) Transcript_33988:4895-5155(-)